MEKSHFLGDWWFFYVIFGDFVGGYCGTPSILQQKHPWENWIKIWDFVPTRSTPPRKLGHPKLKNFYVFFLHFRLFWAYYFFHGKVTLFGWLMIFYVIFGDFVGWDWGTPAILQQKHPWKNWIKIWDWQTPTPLSWDKRPNFSTDLIWGLP